MRHVKQSDTDIKDQVDEEYKQEKNLYYNTMKKQNNFKGNTDLTIYSTVKTVTYHIYYNGLSSSVTNKPICTTMWNN